MPKGGRAKREPSSSESESEESSEESSDPTPDPPKRRQTVSRRGNAKPSRGRGPPRRGSMPGGYPQDSDNERPRKASTRGGGPRRVSREAESDDDDDAESKPPPRKAGAHRGAPSQPISRHVKSDDDDDVDDKRVKPRQGRGNASHGGRAGGARPVSRRAPSDRGDEGDDEVDDTRPPRRQAAKSRDPGSDDDDGPDSYASAQRPSNPAGRRGASPVRFSPIELDPPIGDQDDDMRRAMALSLQEPPSVRPPDDDEDEQLRRVIEASMAEAATARERASHNSDEDPDYLRIIEASQREHEAWERERAWEAKRLARQQEEEMERAIEASKRAARQSGHSEDENQLERARRLSQVTANDDVRRAAERMAQDRNTTQGSASWTESNINSGRRETESSSTPAPAQTDTSAPAAKPSKPKRTVSQRLGLSKSKKPSKKPASTLAAIPETAAIAGPSTPSPSSPAYKSKTTTAHSSNPESTSKGNFTPQDPPTSQALIQLRETPIKPEALIAMCERAFPPDPAIALALRNSQVSRSIERVQQDPDSDPEMASAIAASLDSAQRNEDQPADVTDTGLDDPPPEYHKSSLDRVLKPKEALKWTTSDYRNNQPGYKKRIDAEVLEIMRLYRLLLEFNDEINPDPKSKGKGKEPLLLTPPESSTEKDASSSTTPPEILDSFDEISRPPIREEVGGMPSAAATRFTSTLPQSARLSRMLADTQGISQSKLPGSRPRRRPERHMEVMARLPITREEDEEDYDGGGARAAEERMGKGTARKVRRDSG
ncbi:MAG: hypothetical protein Q9181_002754, partial [Wetmoreana brouardii]